MNDAIKEYAGVDFDTIKTDEEAKALAKERGIEFEERHTKLETLNLLWIRWLLLSKWRYCKRMIHNECRLD